MSVEMQIIYKGDLSCEVVHGPSGIAIVTNAPADNGGEEKAFSPTDLVGAALGSCVLTIMGLFAKRGGVDISGTTIRLSKEMTTEPSRRIGKIKMSIAFPKDRDIDDVQLKKLKRAVENCPVRQSLHSDVIIETEYL